MKRLLKIAFTFLMLTALFNACKKEPLNLEKDSKYQQAFSIDKNEINRALLIATSAKSTEKGKMFTAWENAKPKWNERTEVTISEKMVTFIPLETDGGTKNKQFLLAYKDENAKVHVKIQAYWSNDEETNSALSIETFSGGIFQINPDGYTQNEFIVNNGKLIGKYQSLFSKKFKDIEDDVSGYKGDFWAWLPSNIFIYFNENGEKDDLCDQCLIECECTEAIMRITYASVWGNTGDDPVLAAYLWSETEGHWIEVYSSGPLSLDQYPYTASYDAFIEESGILCICGDSGGTEGNNNNNNDDDINTIIDNTDENSNGGGNSVSDWENILSQMLSISSESNIDDSDIPRHCFDEEESRLEDGIVDMTDVEIAQIPAIYTVVQWGGLTDNIISKAFYLYSTDITVTSIWEGLRIAEESPYINGIGYLPYTPYGFLQTLSSAIQAMTNDLHANNNADGEVDCTSLMPFGDLMEYFNPFLDDIEELRARVLDLQNQLELSDDEANWLLEHEDIVNEIPLILEEYIDEPDIDMSSIISMVIKLEDANMVNGPFEEEYFQIINNTLDESNWPCIPIPAGLPGFPVNPFGFSVALSFESATLRAELAASGEELSDFWFKTEAYKRTILSCLHTVLQGAGMIPGAGIVFDVIDGGIYTLQGEGVEAAFSFSSALPIGGWFVSSARWAKKLLPFRKSTLVWLKNGSRVAFKSKKALRSQLRRILGTPSGEFAHHVIPLKHVVDEGVQSTSHGLVQKAAKSNTPWHPNEATFDSAGNVIGGNGVSLGGVAHSGNHTAYSQRILDKMNQSVLEAGGIDNITQDAASNMLRQIVSEVRQVILSNPGIPLDNLIF